MSAPAPAATVALIASAILDRKTHLGLISPTDFSDLKKYGTTNTYWEETMERAVTEAWDMVRLAEAYRPKNG